MLGNPVRISRQRGITHINAYTLYLHIDALLVLHHTPEHTSVVALLIGGTDCPTPPLHLLPDL